ncbi:MAG: DnaJ domain-containing protein [Campylobacter sputorum]|uniref:DnaJ domain-containing protein n=1 Tax=Campylobacter sputorum TaxID=206 RepID=UPI000B7753CA|nr:DnaJ domain-containing protein [Campylobacter sputorum]ASM37228.1 DnaJ-like membrane chaperone protein (N-terminal terB-like domain) [Campylobacter sputorum bv. faecalis CCUG 20703]ASM38894.1 DnaJ-like membrane chaperone protein (N-terminal terB-like domain) [Campylobacter sputorum bv. paraureolyticus LMG 11764]MDY6121133.1 DnaJ domain-containing protein [Campylobacter sputorum]
MNLLLFIGAVFFAFWLIAGGTKNFTYQQNKRKFSYEEAVYIVSLLAKITKSDGRVSAKEANLVSQILTDITNALNGSNTTRENLKRVFNAQKMDLSNTFKLALEYKIKFNLSEVECMQKIYSLLNIVYVDGEITDDEIKIITKIADGFSINQDILKQIISSFDRSFTNKNAKENSKKSPYEILGVDKNTDFNDIKKAYRELVKKYHPDILMGKGENDEAVQNGTKKLQEINEAYESLKKIHKQ